MGKMGFEAVFKLVLYYTTYSIGPILYYIVFRRKNILYLNILVTFAWNGIFILEIFHNIQCSECVQPYDIHVSVQCHEWSRQHLQKFSLHCAANHS